MKNILVINGCFPPPYGGIGKWLSGVLPELATQGYHFHVIMQGTSNFSVFNSSNLKTYNMNPPEKLMWLWFSFYYSLVFFPDLFKRVFVFKLPLFESIDTLSYWGPVVDRVLKQDTTIDAIHFHDTPWSQGWIALLFGRRFKKRVLATTYGEVVPHRDPVRLIDDLSYKYKPFCRDVLERCDRVSSITKYCCSNLSFLDANLKKVYLTYPVYGLENFKIEVKREVRSLIQDRFNISPRDKIVLFVGQLQERKGPEVLAKAFISMLDKNSNLKLVFVGPDMGSGNAILQIFKEKGLERHLLITGTVSHDLLIGFYDFAKIFVFPTISKIECLGLSFIQAGAMKKAVIASNISGVPEVIRDGIDGLLFEPGNIDNLSLLLKNKLNDDDFLEFIGNNLYNRISDIFEESIVIDQLKKFYDF